VKTQVAELLRIPFIQHVLQYRPKSSTARLAGMLALATGLLDNARGGFIKMAQENIQLHNEITILKDENEALKRLLKVPE